MPEVTTEAEHCVSGRPVDRRKLRVVFRKVSYRRPQADRRPFAATNLAAATVFVRFNGSTRACHCY